MKGLFICIILLCLSNIVKSQLAINVIDKLTGKGVEGVQINSTKQTFKTDNKGLVWLRSEFTDVLTQDITLEHHKYDFDVKNLLEEGEVDLSDDWIFIKIYAYPRKLDLRYVDLAIAKKSKIMNDSLNINFVLSENLQLGYTATNKKLIEIKSSERYAYDNLLKAQITFNYDDFPLQIPLSTQALFQEKAFIRLKPLHTWSSEGSRLALEQSVLQNLELQDKLSEMQTAKDAQADEYEYQISAYKDALRIIRSGGSVPLGPIEERLLKPQPEYEISDITPVFYPPNHRLKPNVGYDLMILNIQYLCSDKSVPYSGDIVVKVDVDESGVANPTILHKPLKTENLISEIKSLISSYDWVPAQSAGRNHPESMIIIFKITKRKK